MRRIISLSLALAFCSIDAARAAKMTLSADLIYDVYVSNSGSKPKLFSRDSKHDSILFDLNGREMIQVDTQDPVYNIECAESNSKREFPPASGLRIVKECRIARSGRKIAIVYKYQMGDLILPNQPAHGKAYVNSETSMELTVSGSQCSLTKYADKYYQVTPGVVLARRVVKTSNMLCNIEN
jgi:hypothetical protein